MGAWPVESKGEKKNSSTQRDKKKLTDASFWQGLSDLKKNCCFFRLQEKKLFSPAYTTDTAAG
jgi:hypothetical protein